MLNSLGLPFNTPFINIRVGFNENDYYKMINNLDVYMEQVPSKVPPKSFDMTAMFGIEGRTQYPLLWYDDIILHGFHYKSQQDMYAQWEKRRKRYHSEKKLIWKYLYDDEDVERFEQIPIKHKIGVYNKKTVYEDIITIPFGETDILKYAYGYVSYTHDLIRTGRVYKCVNLFERMCRINDRWD